MQLKDVPYFQRLKSSPERFTSLFVLLCNNNPEAACNLADRISQLVPKDYVVRTAAYRAYQRMREILRSHDWSENLETSYPVASFAIALGYLRDGSQDSLTTFIEDLRQAGDGGEDAVELLVRTLDLTFCEHCEEPEYENFMTTTWEDHYRCRGCIGLNYIYSGYYDQYINAATATTALDEENSRVTISREDDDFYFDDDVGSMVHRNYEPTEPSRAALLGGYHSSKNYFRKQHDDWTKINKRFFGVELEVELADQYADNDVRLEKVETLNNVVNAGQLGKKVFFERDGSLNNGFEIITQPMSLPAHKELWSFLDDKSVVRGLLSHKAPNGTCGLHVHLNRDGLSTLQIAKMVAFVNNPANRQFMLALARRDRPGYAKYKDWKGKVGKSATYSEERYDAVNLTNSRTIEFRIFKGTLKREALIAALEFVNALAAYTAMCGECSVSDVSHDAFMHFTQKRMPSETATLLAYVNNRLVREAEVC